MAEELKTVTLKDVEILRAGTFNAAKGGRQTFTAEDLAEFQAAHEALIESGYHPTVYLGHNQDEGSGLPEPPSVGRIASLRVEGDRLLAELTDVPALVGKLVQAKAYGTRSIEGMRCSWAKAVDIGGRKYRQVLTGLALLGKSFPAVSSLADVEKLYAAAAEAEQEWVDVPVLQLAAGMDPVEEALSGLDAWAELAMELIKGKTFAPAIRQRVRMLKEDFRRIAAGTTTVEASMTDDSIAVALAGATDPVTALAIIAEILGMPDATPPDLVAKVRVLAGGTAMESETEGETAMKSGNLNDLGGESATVLKLQAEQSDLLQRLAKIEGERARDAATSLVDGHIQAGRFVPAQRETLVKLALSSPADFEAFAGAAPVQVHLGEKGTSHATDAAAYEPSAEELRVAMAMGLTREAAAKLHRDNKKGTN